MTRGKVKWYNEIKGYGFIVTEYGDDIFVHRSGLLHADGGLAPEQEVEFEIRQGEKGLFAADVK